MVDESPRNSVFVIRFPSEIRKRLDAVLVALVCCSFSSFLFSKVLKLRLGEFF